MLLVFLLAMQFATSNGDLMCFVNKYLPCYKTFIDGANQQKCTADATIKCLQDIAESCDVKNSNETKAVEEILGNTCKEGTEMNKAYWNSRDCAFGTSLTQVSVQCYEGLIEAELKYGRTGNTEDRKAMVKIACKYSDAIRKCVRANVKEVCGDETLSFQLKLSDPVTKLEEKVCNSSPASFGLIWTLLLQAAAILMSLEYFRLAK